MEAVCWIILINLSISLWITFLLVMWFDGDITNLFSRTKYLQKVFLRKEYKIYTEDEDVMATYPDFLHNRYNTFITKLISCVICLPAWLTLLITISYYITLNINISWVILFLPINYITSLLLYLLIRKLL